MNCTSTVATASGSRACFWHGNACMRFTIVCMSLLAGVVAIALLKTLVVAIGYPEIAVKNENLLIYQTDFGSVAEARGTFVSSSGQMVRISRELIHVDTKETLVLPASDKQIGPGEESAASLFAIPANLMAGEWCMHYTLRWQPAFSLLERVEKLQLGCERPQHFIHSFNRSKPG